MRGAGVLTGGAGGGCGFAVVAGGGCAGFDVFGRGNGCGVCAKALVAHKLNTTALIVRSTKLL